MIRRISSARRDAGPWGDASRYLPLETLVQALRELSPPRDVGTLALVVARGEQGRRITPRRTLLTSEDGVLGDAWARKSPERFETQITLIRVDIARLVANGQPLSLFGDNLLVDLDLCTANLPSGSRLRVGAALLEVTPVPHTGCLKFRERFGAEALRFTADRRFRELRLRGIHAKVIEAGEVSPGDPVEVVKRNRGRC